MPERMLERIFEFGNPEGRGGGGSCSFGIPGERRVKKCAFRRGGVHFSGITQCRSDVQCSSSFFQAQRLL